jgi:hypothetical protein
VDVPLPPDAAAAHGSRVLSMISMHEVEKAWISAWGETMSGFATASRLVGHEGQSSGRADGPELT